LTYNGDGSYTLTRQDQTHLHFSEDGLLTSIATSNQLTTTLSYAVQYRDPCRLPRPRPWWHLVYLPATWVFDHPEDRVETTIGMRLWNAHAVNVQTSHIMNAVLEAGDRGEISRTRDTPSWY